MAEFLFYSLITVSKQKWLISLIAFVTGSRAGPSPCVIFVLMNNFVEYCAWHGVLRSGFFSPICKEWKTLFSEMKPNLVQMLDATNPIFEAEPDTKSKFCLWKVLM